MKPSIRSTLVILPDVPLGNISAGDESAGPEAPSPPAPAGNSTLTWAKQCREETEREACPVPRAGSGKAG